MPREYEKEFKRDSVSAFEQSDKKRATFCRDIGVPESTFEKWLVKYGAPKEKSNENPELTKLKKELFDVTMERDILKKSIAIFATLKK